MLVGAEEAQGASHTQREGAYPTCRGVRCHFPAGARPSGAHHTSGGLSAGMGGVCSADGEDFTRIKNGV